MVATAKTDKKQKDHLFKPGKSGNPKGRPVGCRNKATILLDTMLQGQAEVLMQKAIAEALSGDSQMLKALIDKLLPNRKDSPVSFEMPTMKKTGDLTKVTAKILKSVGAGELSPGEASGLTKLIETHLKAIELTELEDRLAQLEKTMKEKDK